MSAGRTKLPTFTAAALMRPADRRGHGAKAALYLEVFEQALARLDGGAEDVGLRLGVVEIDHRRGVLADQLGIAADIALGAGELRLIARQAALGGLDLGVHHPAIEREQLVARVDMGAVLTKCTAVMVVSTRALSATLAIGVTVPSASSRTGIFLRTSLGDFDRHHSAPGAPGRCASVLSAVQKPRAKKATPTKASTAAPRSHFLFVISTFGPGYSTYPDTPFSVV